MSPDDAAGDRYSCRWCSQPLNPGALRCYYCQTWQDPDANKKLKSSMRESSIGANSWQGLALY
jgi:hypothetical protein